MNRKSCGFFSSYLVHKSWSLWTIFCSSRFLRLVVSVSISFFFSSRNSSERPSGLAGWGHLGISGGYGYSLSNDDQLLWTKRRGSNSKGSGVEALLGASGVFRQRELLPVYRYQCWISYCKFSSDISVYRTVDISYRTCFARFAHRPPYLFCKYLQNESVDVSSIETAPFNFFFYCRYRAELDSFSIFDIRYPISNTAGTVRTELNLYRR